MPGQRLPVSVPPGRAGARRVPVPKLVARMVRCESGCCAASLRRGLLSRGRLIAFRRFCRLLAPALGTRLAGLLGRLQRRRVEPRVAPTRAGAGRQARIALFGADTDLHQATEGDRDMLGRAVEAVVEVEEVRCRSDVVAPQEAQDALARPCALRAVRTGKLSILSRGWSHHRTREGQRRSGGQRDAPSGPARSAGMAAGDRRRSRHGGGFRCRRSSSGRVPRPPENGASLAACPSPEAGWVRVRPGRLWQSRGTPHQVPSGSPRRRRSPSGTRSSSRSRRCDRRTSVRRRTDAASVAASRP